MFRAPFVFLFASLAILSGSPPQAAPITASINPVADAFVTTGPSDGPLDDFNYGSAGALGISGAEATRTGVTPAQRGIFQTFLRFNLTQARQSFDVAFGAGNWTIQSASMRFSQTNPNNALYNDLKAGDFAIDWIAADNWIEGTGNPNGPTTDGISYDDLPLPGSMANLGTFQFLNAGGTQTYNLSLAASFTADVIGDASALTSFQLFATDEANSQMSYRFTSKDNMGSSVNYPLLTIIAVPEPPAACLMAGAIVLGAAVRWKSGLRTLQSRGAHDAREFEGPWLGR